MPHPRALLATLLLAACGGEASSRAPDGPAAVPSAIDVGEGVLVEPTREGLQAFVRAGRHQGWAHEPAPHPSTGPHADVQMFFNAAYREARRAERYPMPAGAMGVKALFSGSTPSGYAVAVKVAEGDGPQTWLWWEATGDLSGGFFGIAAGICEGCHRGSSRDRSLVTMVP